MKYFLNNKEISISDNFSSLTLDSHKVVMSEEVISSNELGRYNIQSLLLEGETPCFSLEFVKKAFSDFLFFAIRLVLGSAFWLDSSKFFLIRIKECSNEIKVVVKEEECLFFSEKDNEEAKIFMVISVFIYQFNLRSDAFFENFFLVRGE